VGGEHEAEPHRDHRRAEVIPALMDAYRQAVVRARENGDTLPVADDVIVILRRWGGASIVVCREDVYDAIRAMGHKLADMPHDAKPARARPVVL
jgi:hypothetical protein